MLCHVADKYIVLPLAPVHRLSVAQLPTSQVLLQAWYYAHLEEMLRHLVNCRDLQVGQLLRPHHATASAGAQLTQQQLLYCCSQNITG